jgi:hypothetical protein
MGAFWRRLLGLERRYEKYRRAIEDMQQRLAAVEQQLADQRSTV